jgi:hypothetical protein
LTMDRVHAPRPRVQPAAVATAAALMLVRGPRPRSSVQLQRRLRITVLMAALLLVPRSAGLGRTVHLPAPMLLAGRFSRTVRPLPVVLRRSPVVQGGALGDALGEFVDGAVEEGGAAGLLDRQLAGVWCSPVCAGGEVPVPRRPPSAHRPMANGCGPQVRAQRSEASCSCILAHQR